MLFPVEYILYIIWKWKGECFGNAKAALSAKKSGKRQRGCRNGKIAGQTRFAKIEQSQKIIPRLVKTPSGSNADGVSSFFHGKIHLPQSY